MTTTGCVIDTDMSGEYRTDIGIPPPCGGCGNQRIKKALYGVIVVVTICFIVLYTYSVAHDIDNNDTEDIKRERFRKRVIISLIILVSFASASVAYVACHAVKKRTEPDWDKLAYHTHMLSYLNGSILARSAPTRTTANGVTEYCKKFDSLKLPNGSLL